MTQTDSVFHRTVSKLLTEIFNGPPGAEAYILNPGDGGLHRQLETISATVASQQPIPGKPSIAAHVDHVHFGLTLLTRWISGEENPWADADWKLETVLKPNKKSRGDGASTRISAMSMLIDRLWFPLREE